MRIGCIRLTRPGARALAVLAPVALLAATTPSLPAQATGDAGRRADSGAVTVAAPGAGAGATVTVTRADVLVNQTVLVSWAGFRPSSSTRLDNSGDALDVNTENPVRVYECRGSDPASSSDCYGAPGFRGIDATDTTPAVPAVAPYTYPGQQDAYDSTPDGPANWQDNVTRADGTGEVAVQVFTKRESASLGCDATSPCSLVVVPNYGRPQGATEDMMDAPWAWERRAVVPLTFLPVDDACPLTGDSLRVEGSPMVAHALASWRARTCTLDQSPVRVDYTAIGEPQTRGDVASGTTDVGLLIDPVDPDQARDRGLVYAPVAVTGLVVAFQVDDAEGKPVTDLRLDPRLVAKLVTGSYRSGGDPAVIHNPVNIFRDPEFRQLNPGIDWPGGAPGNHPLLLGDLSDTTLALTRWLAADKDASAFLDGTPDPWGMTVNANYAKVPLPFASFPLLDPLLSQTFEPVQDLDTLARQLSIARFPGALVTQEGGVNVVTKPPRQNPGRREVIGIIDAASAARFRLSTASLENAAGQYVQPTDAALLSGMRHSVLNADGVTRSVDLTSKDPTVYPLSLLVSAALSTKAPQAERTEMADLLDYVAGPGQEPGEQVGQLPEGHAPLPAAMRAQVAAARTAVLRGYVAPSSDPTPDPTDPSDAPTPPDPSAAPAGGGGGSLPHPQGPAPVAAGPSASPAATPSAAAPDALGPVMLTVGSQPAGRRALVLPLLGLLALLGVLLGPGLLWLGGRGRGPQWLRR
ncbi:MAG: hypothetical protein ACXVW4_10465 [Nocardioides sp.]